MLREYLNICFISGQLFLLMLMWAKDFAATHTLTDAEANWTWYKVNAKESGIHVVYAALFYIFAKLFSLEIAVFRNILTNMHLMLANALF